MFGFHDASQIKTRIIPQRDGKLPAAMHDPRYFPRSALLLLTLLTLGWGLNWPVMKIVLAEVPPLYFRGTCLFLGGLGMLVLAAANGQRVTIARTYWRPMLVLTLTNMLGWNVFAVYGVHLLPAGRAALLGYTMPLWSVPLSAWLLHEKLHLRHALALVLGMAGVAFLVSEDLGKLGSAPLGVLCMLSAACFWGAGVVMLKRYALPIPTSTLTGWTMLAGGIPLLLVAFFLETHELHMPGQMAVLGVVYNVVVAFMFCYWAWNRIVLMMPVAVSSLSALFIPVVGVLSGMALLGERPGWQEVLGGLLILAAISSVLPLRGQRRATL